MFLCIMIKESYYRSSKCHNSTFTIYLPIKIINHTFNDAAHVRTEQNKTKQNLFFVIYIRQFLISLTEIRVCSFCVIPGVGVHAIVLVLMFV